MNNIIVGFPKLYLRGCLRSEAARAVFLFYVILVRFTPQVRNNKPPLCGCALDVIQKISKRVTIKGFKPIVKQKEKNMAQKTHSLSPTKWSCKHYIMFTPSIDEKSFIINIEVAQVRYSTDYVVTRELMSQKVISCPTTYTCW